MEPIFAAGVALRLRSDRDRTEGLGQNDKAHKFLGQDFESLRTHCLQSKRLFEDDYFPAKHSSLGFKELGPSSAKAQGVRWLRPTVRKDAVCGLLILVPLALLSISCSTIIVAYEIYLLYLF